MVTTKIVIFKPFIGLIGAILLAMSSMSFVATKDIADKDVMIYCIVYQEMCGGSHVKAHFRDTVPAENYRAALDAMKTGLEKKYPGLKVVPHSSRDCCKDASNVCIITWTKKNKDCSYDVVAYEFASTHQAALDKAIKRKNDFGGSDTQSSTKNFYW
jgi:hypothetical protein